MSQKFQDYYKGIVFVGERNAQNLSTMYLVWTKLNLRGNTDYRSLLLPFQWMQQVWLF